MIPNTIEAYKQFQQQLTKLNMLLQEHASPKIKIIDEKHELQRENQLLKNYIVSFKLQAKQANIIKQQNTSLRQENQLLKSKIQQLQRSQQLPRLQSLPNVHSPQQISQYLFSPSPNDAKHDPYLFVQPSLFQDIITLTHQLREVNNNNRDHQNRIIEERCECRRTTGDKINKANISRSRHHKRI